MSSYQFQIDYRPTCPIRATWKEAACDAVQSGYGEWITAKCAAVRLDPQANIARIS